MKPRKARSVADPSNCCARSRRSARLRDANRSSSGAYRTIRSGARHWSRRGSGFTDRQRTCPERTATAERRCFGTHSAHARAGWLAASRGYDRTTPVLGVSPVSPSKALTSANGPSARKRRGREACLRTNLLISSLAGRRSFNEINKEFPPSDWGFLKIGIAVRRIQELRDPLDQLFIACRPAVIYTIVRQSGGDRPIVECHRIRLDERHNNTRCSQDKTALRLIAAQASGFTAIPIISPVDRPSPLATCALSTPDDDTAPHLDVPAVTNVFIIPEIIDL
jgi:hypothetical protein